MTATHLYRGNERGEILDADGKVVGRIVPPIPKLAMIIRGEQHGENAGGIYRAMLSAAPTDWSSVAVRAPDPEIGRRQFNDEEHKFAWTDGWLSALIALGVRV